MPTWTIVGRRVPGPTFTQYLLTPGIPYTFLVRAENAHGIGPPSLLSEPIFVGSDTAQSWGNPEVTVLSEARANLISGNIVRLTEALPVLSTAIKLTWDILDSQYVEGLYVYYVAMDAAPDLPKSYSMLTVLHTGGSSGFTVNNLEKWAKYRFFLVPFFKTVEGQPSNSRVVRTLEDGKSLLSTYSHFYSPACRLLSSFNSYFAHLYICTRGHKKFNPLISEQSLKMTLPNFISTGSSSRVKRIPLYF